VAYPFSNGNNIDEVSEAKPMGITRLLLCIVLSLVLILICLLLVKLGNWVDKSWTQSCPPVNYLKSSQAKREPWRWRQPDRQLNIPYETNRELGIQNSPHASSLIFRKEFRLADFTAHLLGTFIIGLDLLALCNSLKPGAIVEEVNFLFILIRYILPLSLGWFLLQLGNRVLQLDLSIDRLSIVTHYAFYLRRTRVYPRDQFLQVKGKIQPFLMMERGQLQPDYSNPI